MKSFWEEIEKNISDQKLDEAIKMLQQKQLEVELNSQNTSAFQLYFGICNFQQQKTNQAIQHFQNVDRNAIESQGKLNLMIKYYLNSLIYEKQYEKVMKESITYLNEQSKETVLIIHQCRGQCFQEQELYLAAIEEYNKSIDNGSKNHIDIAYCHLQLEELEECEKYVNQYNEQENLDVQGLLVKSDLYLRTNREREGARVLFTAYQYYKAKSINLSQYTPKELAYLDSKLNEKNGHYIEAFYRETKSKKLTYVSKNTFQQFVKELNNKAQNELSNQIEEQIKRFLSRPQLLLIQAEKDVENALQNQEIKFYYDSFISTVEQTYTRASGFVNRFQMKNDDLLISFGIELLALVPLVGQSVSSVVNSLQTEIRYLQVTKRSQALIEVANTREQFLLLIKQTLAAILQNEQKILQIKNPQLSKSFESYMREVLQLQLKIKKEIVGYLDDIYTKEKNVQELLAVKDAGDLLGTYFSSGYLQLCNDRDEDELPKICADYVLAEGERKQELRKQVSQLISKQHDQEIVKSSCCIIF